MLTTAYTLNRQTDRQTDRQTSITAPFLRVKINIVATNHLEGQVGAFCAPLYLSDGFLRP